MTTANTEPAPLTALAQRVLEHFDAELSETDDAGRPAVASTHAVLARNAAHLTRPLRDRRYPAS